jgi:hypothetical protein
MEAGGFEPVAIPLALLPHRLSFSRNAALGSRSTLFTSTKSSVVLMGSQ